jgi:serine/threonine protein kinase
MIDFSCLQCQTKLKVQDELAGKRIRCRHCQHVQTVPLPSQEATPVLPPDAAPSRGHAHIAEQATRPPVSHPPPAEEATVPPRSAPLPDQTANAKAPGDAPTDGATSGAIQGSFAYEVAGEMARGGMGAILRAFDRDIHREVALKVLLNQDDAGLRARFIEEAQIAGQLEHPNIVPIHQLGVHADGCCFFSMKMVKGRSLADILKEQGEPGALPTGGAFTLVRLLSIFSNICNALGYAHSRNVIHRDLKPANVMVGSFGEVYVMDWGLAKVLDRKVPVAEPRSEPSKKPSASKVATSRGVDSHLTQAGAIMGTPAYMPPEQAMGEIEAVDQRSDIYSLGAILYEMLTLSPPVGQGGDDLAVLLRVVEGDIKPPEQQAPQRARLGLIPPELAAVALKALSKEPADRYQTVEALQRDIQLYLEGRSVSAKHDTAWELLKKLIRRNKGASLATTAALVVLAVVAAVFLKINYDARVRAEESYDAYLKEQEQRKKQGRDSIPSFLTAARLLMDKRDFDAARAQVRVALDLDPEHTEARYLKGQLALVGEDFAQAQQELEVYARQRPDDLLARDLLEFLPRARTKDASTGVVLAEICTRHQAYALADGALKSLGENAHAARNELLQLYQQRLEKRWGKNAGRGLTLDPGAGTFFLRLPGNPEVTELERLRGMPLQFLDISADPVVDLEPLQGMPLRWLKMSSTDKVSNLTPLRDMKLTWLHLGFLYRLTNLGPLRRMPLEVLYLTGCHNVTDLSPLQGMPLTELHCDDRLHGMKVSNLSPLAGMKLRALDLGGASLITDIRPLRDMPLESRSLNGLREVQDFEPLRGRPLTYLDLSHTRIDDLTVLTTSPLKELQLQFCRQLKDLTPLADLPLTLLNLSDCPVEDLQPLTRTPLETLILIRTRVHDLTPVAKMQKLRNLFLDGCRIDDLSPLRGMRLRVIGLSPGSIKKGWEVLWDMKSLETVKVDGGDEVPVADFRKRYGK